MSEHCVALFGTRNEDKLNRTYRLCAWFGVAQLAVVGSRARIRGNVFSAAGQVEIVYLATVDDFLGWWSGSILVAALRGGHPPGDVQIAGPTAFCFGSEIDPVPGDVTRVADARITIPQLGRAPCLMADQAAAIVLYASL